jgi:hypothetical protein
MTDLYDARMDGQQPQAVVPDRPVAIYELLNG